MRAPFQILAIPYRRQPRVQYCVFRRANTDIYQFIAGGGEGDERTLDAAIREIKEETGIETTPSTIIQLTSLTYIPVDAISKKYRKLWGTDTYVIPEYAFGFECDAPIRLSKEHTSFEWLAYDEALQKLTWDSNKTALYELHRRLFAKSHHT